MEININEKYEIAYDFYGKMFETVDADSLNERISIAIEKTIQCMSALIDDGNISPHDAGRKMCVG